MGFTRVWPISMPNTWFFLVFYELIKILIKILINCPWDPWGPLQNFPWDPWGPQGKGKGKGKWKSSFGKLGRSRQRKLACKRLATRTWVQRTFCQEGLYIVRNGIDGDGDGASRSPTICFNMVSAITMQKQWVLQGFGRYRCQIPYFSLCFKILLKYILKYLKIL